MHIQVCTNGIKERFASTYKHCNGYIEYFVYSSMSYRILQLKFSTNA